MRYTVVWLAEPTQALARLWNDAHDRQAVANAADQLDVELRDNPDVKGTPLRKFYRLRRAPLEVLYRVAPLDRMVQVISVKRLQPGEE